MPTSLPLIDAALRGALVAWLLVLAAALWRTRSTHAVARTGLALTLGLVVQAFASTPALEREWPVAWQAPGVGVSVGNAVLFWLFARALFDDGFALRRRHAAVWAVVAGIGAGFCTAAAVVGPHASATRAFAVALRWAPAVFAVLTIAAAAQQWRADLVERRRSLRGFIVGAGALYTVAMVAARLATPHGLLSGLAASLDIAGLLAIIGVAAFSTLRLTDGGLLPDEVVGPPAQAGVGRVKGVPEAGSVTLADVGVAALAGADGVGGADDVGGAGGDTTSPARAPRGGAALALAWQGTPPPRPPSRRAARVADAADAVDTADGSAMDAIDTPVADALQRAMQVDEAWRLDDLTLPLLALKLGVPEYRLRRHIHQRLGQRNFNVYVNGLRLADARAALADPARLSEPVLAVAMQAGFASIGPFNRAFKAATGLTPSEFRRRQAAGVDVDAPADS